MLCFRRHYSATLPSDMTDCAVLPTDLGCGTERECAAGYTIAKTGIESWSVTLPLYFALPLPFSFWTADLYMEVACHKCILNNKTVTIHPYQYMNIIHVHINYVQQLSWQLLDNNAFLRLRSVVRSRCHNNTWLARPTLLQIVWIWYCLVSWWWLHFHKFITSGTTQSNRLVDSPIVYSCWT